MSDITGEAIRHAANVQSAYNRLLTERDTLAAKLEEVRAENSQLREFIAAKTPQEARNAIEYGLRVQERDEAREEIQRQKRDLCDAGGMIEQREETIVNLTKQVELLTAEMQALRKSILIPHRMTDEDVHLLCLPEDWNRSTDEE